MVLALREGYFSKLFLFHPSQVPLTRVTTGAWHDMTPAISPDGRYVAFGSNRAGVWDIYSLDLITGDTRRHTDTDYYESGPAWSPDGLFLVYEANQQGNLDLFILPFDGSSDPIQVTHDTYADHSPSWSPLGQEIAFVSTRSGSADIWTVDLQSADDRLKNISQRNDAREYHPAWAPNGTDLAWSVWSKGRREIAIWQPGRTTAPLRMIGSGDRPEWHPDGNIVLTEVSTPDKDYLSGYTLKPFGQISLQLLPLPGSLEGMSWATATFPASLPASIAAAAQASAPVLWKPSLIDNGEIPGGRQGLVNLDPAVEAPDPRMHDIADESFMALLEAATGLLGWDFLTSLENAFVPLTNPLHPGMGNDWLYTGRAFASNPAPVSAGWIQIVREDYGHETFWCIFVLTRFQDGSQGRPMYGQPWDINARFSGDPTAYEAGGATALGPAEGYWLDFTELTRAYGWSREPALSSWRSFYQGSRFNEFVFRMGLDWQTAMLELYPPEVLITPSPITPITPSITPTRTATPTETLTPTVTQTPEPSATTTLTQPAAATLSPTPS